MVFNSVSFGLFIALVFLLYWMVPQRFQKAVLLLANIYFYASFSLQYTAILAVTTAVAYITAVGFTSSENAEAGQTAQRRKKRIAVCGIVTVLGFLAVLKYTGFLLEAVSDICSIFLISLPIQSVRLLLPVGISFYTLQLAGYLIDVYRGKIEAERNIIDFTIFATFFPVIVSGPIERAEKLLPQIKIPRKFHYETAAYGLKLMVWGYFKKLVIADTICGYVDLVFNDVHAVVGSAFIYATLLYTIQIYCDFSGYTDIAVGVGRLLGFKLTDNFKSPYFAVSIKDFWRRWHISLSSWLKDYVYISLGGNRVSKKKNYVNLLITFLVSGIWHGADWSYLVWGGLHGCYQVVQRMLKKQPKGQRKDMLPSKDGKGNIIAFRKTTGIVLWGRRLLTFLAVSFAWLFFRADGLKDAWYMITHAFVGIRYFVQYWQIGIWYLNMGLLNTLVIVLSVLVLGIYDYTALKRDPLLVMKKWPAAVRYTVYMTFLFMIIFFSQTPGSGGEFIYAQF